MKNKKGLSEVVTNVLIVLLVIVAIGAIWAFIYPMITKSGAQIEASQACLTLSTAMEITKCAISGTNVSVLVKRGAGTADLKEVKLIFEKDDGSTLNITTHTNVPTELETKAYSLTNLGGNPKAVALVPGIVDAKTNKITSCAPLPKLECK
ncbi:MAG: hypothetical protein N3D20_01090 [Candidatus Pacearchaeota archaeon]|nr:hypothetical protein [Candidatus Pacearchaeota archaeon]